MFGRCASLGPPERRRRRWPAGRRLRRSLAVLLLGPAATAGELFVESAAESGLVFVHENGMSGRLRFVEMMCPGVALVDVDGDGDLDAFFPQGHPLDASVAVAGWPRDRLFRNDLESPSGGQPRLRFTDVSASSGIEQGEGAAAVGYGCGVAVGDADGDGRPDLYVTNWGANRLYRNQGEGRFRDVTAESGTGDDAWGTGATLFDLDRDGRLDLYVTNYVAFELGRPGECFAPSSAPDYCGPTAYRAQPDVLFHNQGDGRFLVSPLPTSGDGGYGLGVVATDADRDGWLDVYVANDGQENYLWMNRRDGTFVDQGVVAGAAVSFEGRPQASMGVAVADHDDDGDEDLFLTHLAGETNTLYRSDGAGNFDDVTPATGLGPPSWPFTGFGTGWLDFDGDNRLDLFVANGAVRRRPEQVAAGSPLPLAERPQLFRNLGAGRYAEVSAVAGEIFARSVVGRGAAFGDLDNDGDVDIVVAVNGGPALLLRNQAPRAHPHWLGLRALTSGRDAYGARLEVRLAGGDTLWRWVRADGSYASANDPRVLVAVPAGGAVERVRVAWLSGRVEEFTGLGLDRYQTLVEGAGAGVPP